MEVQGSVKTQVLMSSGRSLIPRAAMEQGQGPWADAGHGEKGGSQQGSLMLGWQFSSFTIQDLMLWLLDVQEQAWGKHPGICVA